MMLYVSNAGYREVMDAPVTVIGLRERMSKLVEMAEMPFHGFPVVEDFDTDKTEGVSGGGSY